MSNGDATLARLRYQRLDTIVGYTYAAINRCPECLTEAFMPSGAMPPGYRSVEDWLNAKAAVMGLNRDEEASFDSDDFPKVLLLAHAPGCCDECGEPLEV